MCFEQYNCEFNKSAQCSTNESLVYMAEVEEAGMLDADIELGNDQLKEAEETASG